MRKAILYEWRKPAGEKNYIRVEIGTVKFHQFGMDYEEFETGPGNFSTAIVECDDGTVKNVPADLIKFVDK